MTDNKIKGICKTVSEKNGGILLQTNDNPDGLWWNGLGDKAKALVQIGLRGKEIELTIVDQTKRTFSYLGVLNGNVQWGVEDMRLRSMAVAYTKDLIINDKATMEELEDTASRIFKFIKGKN